VIPHGAPLLHVWAVFVYFPVTTQLCFPLSYYISFSFLFYFLLYFQQATPSIPHAGAGTLRFSFFSFLCFLFFFLLYFIYFSNFVFFLVFMLIVSRNSSCPTDRTEVSHRPADSCCRCLSLERISYLALKIMLIFYLTPKIKIFPICPHIEFSFSI
jgi:hypothetical protein